MTETAINYFLVELDRKLKDLEFFSKQQGISLGAAKRANEIHKEIIELVRPFTTDEKTVEKLQERCDRYEKALTEIDCSRYGMQFRRNRNPNVARQALAAIRGDDESLDN